MRDPTRPALGTNPSAHGEQQRLGQDVGADTGIRSKSGRNERTEH